jgi:hypothetical protein
MIAAVRRVLPCVSFALACGGAPAKPADGTPVADDPPSPAAPPVDAAAPARSDATALLEWLDPDAIAVAWVALPEGLDIETFATVFAVPPKVARLLVDVVDVDAALATALPADAPAPSTWLGTTSLAMATRFSSGTYVIRRLRAPKDVAMKALVAARMRSQEIDGFTVLMPEGALPFRVVFLGEDVVAFISAREIGSGLGPLTAGRDLPIGGTERELATVLAEAPDAALEVYAAGPLLHFDLGDAVAQFAVRARKWQDGLDVQVRLAPDGDAPAALTALGERDVSLESAAVRLLSERVAFTLDGSFVEGRLQLTADDLAVLGVRR